MQRLRNIDWAAVRRDSQVIFSKLTRTRNPQDTDDPGTTLPTRTRLSRCLTTLDLISLGVASCVGTGMYLVTGLVAHKFAGPGVALSFFIAALASIFSGVCYAEFAVRVPHTTGSAYSYSYATVGEFIAFIIGWNMMLEYMNNINPFNKDVKIGTSACARALSACVDSIFNGVISEYLASKIGTIYGKPPDLIACGIVLLMTMILVTGVKKSLFFNNILNAINLVVWVFMMGAGFFYVDTSNWTQHKGFLPYGWSGVFSGAATCFYAFIGFDIIATTGEEAINPKRSIPLAIVISLIIILIAYICSSVLLTLMVPYTEVDVDSALMQMFSYVRAPACKYIVAVGAIAGLTAAMFGSLFPMPRIIYAMALDGLIFIQLARVSETSGSPALAAVIGGVAASFVSLVIQLEVLVEMMSIGTLLAYTLVSTCVLILRYQPHITNLIELLPQKLRTPADAEATGSGQRNTTVAVFDGVGPSQVTTSNQQRVMIRRVTRSSPDSDDSLPGNESEDYEREDAFLINSNNENQFYVPGGCSAAPSRCARFFNSMNRQMREMSYLCPRFLPWVDCGPATEMSGIYVIKAVGMMYILVIVFDILAVYGNPSESTFTAVVMIMMILAIFIILLAISRKPQNRAHLVYVTPGLPFVPAIAILVNIYLILNLSILTLIRFTIWMIFGLIMYFKYGIKNSTLERNASAPRAFTPPPPNPFDRTIIPALSNNPLTTGDRNIFEGDGSGLYGFHDTYNERTSMTTSHTANRPPWAYPDSPYEWD